MKIFNEAEKEGTKRSDNMTEYQNIIKYTLRKPVCRFFALYLQANNQSKAYMKRIIFALAAMAALLPANAQETRYDTRVPSQFTTYAEDYGIYYGLRLGLTVTTVNSDDERLDGGSAQAGINIGAIIGIQLTQKAPVYFETGIFYTEKGGKGRMDDKKITYDLNYLEFPLLVKYKYEIDENFGVHPFVGGYLACGIGGKVKDYGGMLSEDGYRDTYSSFSEDFFRRFDAGLRIGCGGEYQMLYAEISYDFGLTNICHSDFESSHNGCFYINIGVNF